MSKPSSREMLPRTSALLKLAIVARAAYAGALSEAMSDEPAAPPAPRMSRRRFLRRTLLGGALLAVGGVVARHATGYSLDDRTRSRLRVLSPKEALVLGAICRRLLAPDEEGAPSPDEIEVTLVIDEYLAGIDRELVSDVRALLHVFEHGASLSAWPPSRFTRLDGAAQDRVLTAWQDSSLDFRRQGFQALKTLAVLGYYDDPRTFPILGYGGPLVGRPG